ncbi:MAG TPA: very short patch repair endonuclease [Terracidiphilus sp.]
MTDTLTVQQRSACMRSVRGKDTTPELIVRSLVHSMGFRYSLHSKKLPGRPDLVFTSRKKVIFVHGCFWHRHRCRHGKVSPASNSEYWNRRRERNFQRDREHIRALRSAGWRVLVLWECWTKDLVSLRSRFASFFETDS